MNIVRAYLYQDVEVPTRIIMVWETADIKRFSSYDEYILIGQVDYDTEKHQIVKYDR